MLDSRDGDRKPSSTKDVGFGAFNTKAATEEQPWTVGGSSIWGITPHLRVDLCMWPDLSQGPIDRLLPMPHWHIGTVVLRCDYGSTTDSPE